MRKLILLILIAILPHTLLAGATVNNGSKLHSASLYSGYTWDPATGTYWQERVYVNEQTNGTYYVQVYRRCYRNYGDCGWYDIYGCYGNVGREAVLVANKNRIILELTPDNCPYTYPYGFSGAHIMWQANGDWENSHDYNDYHRRWEGPQGEQCFYHSDSGKAENRSADAEGQIEGVDIARPASISTYSTGHYVHNCSN